ncbi:hypothetical protein ABZ079_01390 [Streptomyces sp. NPDC006314]|uniref:hypothetical protein n=1 Tax=Streptomyces sp. NPDC006314 TaxID=3154475 RepID=UPI0033BB7295
MSGHTFLIGGGWDTAEVYEPFLRAAGADGPPRIGCLAVDEGDGAVRFERYAAALRTTGPCTPVPLPVPLGGRFEAEAALAGVDGLLVCDGLTPAYQEALTGCLDRLPGLLAARGVPYAGFSAGAALAARRAVVGGWLVDGVPVCPDETGEDLAEVEVRAGLGLLPFAVDVHAAQWGTLTPAGGRDRAGCGAVRRRRGREHAAARGGRRGPGAGGRGPGGPMSYGPAGTGACPCGRTAPGRASASHRTERPSVPRGRGGRVRCAAAAAWGGQPLTTHTGGRRAARGALRTPHRPFPPAGVRWWPCR